MSPHLKFALPNRFSDIKYTAVTDSKATISAEEPSNADILRAVQKVSERVGKIETRLNFHFIGLLLLLGIMVWLHTDQNARISRVEARLETKIAALDIKIDRIEDSFAIQRNTACQCEKEN